MAEEPAAPPPGGSEFDTGAKGESYTRSQSVDGAPLLTPSVDSCSLRVLAPAPARR
eukprot:COSAG04_NODE_151_length_22485_cov_15.968552_12_plen_56_part_00